jgi:hypothetical protein
VAELDEHVVALLHLVQNGFPTAFVQKTQAASAVHGVVVHHDIAFVKEAGERLPPPPFQGLVGKRFVGTSGIAYGEDGDFLFGGESE